MPGTRLVLGPAKGRTRVPGMTEERLRYTSAAAAAWASGTTS
jgi:hypothetical protein